MNIALIDLAHQRSKLYPLTQTRPIADLRIGILTIREKWEKRLNTNISFLAHSSLAEKFPPLHPSFDLIINGAICPNDELITAIQNLCDNTVLCKGEILLAAKGSFNSSETLENLDLAVEEYLGDCVHIDRTWDLFLNNAHEIQQDFDLLTKGRTSETISDPYTIVYGKENVFLEEGVNIKAAILNAENGPIYLAKDSEIQEGATIRGPFALGEGARINMNSKIREGSTIGPGCKVGGEVSNSILYGNSNKAHDGFLGNSVLGEWCNLGADTNNSNLKNNYAKVTMWDEISRDFIDTGLQFCGLIMGDHSKSAINTMFNTGTTVGVCANVYGAGFPRTRIPSFAWGGVRSMLVYDFDKAIETVDIVMKRKGQTMEQADVNLLRSIFEDSKVTTE
ncbi:putative sugar nucleotidyl transferase [Reichenbachiella agarivorans]|uniref:Sugar nucleotidyl transferase n=1 Tax=Reichenbachiella agarivorans TaxID=2979464 RepID=A0ABY6CV59_9BACT|nr:putative sugar nucleotidyl transferase [Reichenbachiella agarivorans]UXP33338.1 putative sugar nucleotidyl transferase [Reichenbachiella agarivorans]